MRTILCKTLLLVSAFVAACEPAEPAEPPEPPAPPEPPEPPAVLSSFEVTATLSFSTQAPISDPYPESVSFVLRLEDAPNGTVSAIWSNTGADANGVFGRTDTGLSLREPVKLPVDFYDQDPAGDLPYIEFVSLRLVLEDGDGDGNADAVTGSGSGGLHFVLGDILYEGTFTLELHGDPDTTPPWLYVVGRGTGHHVLEGLEVKASELLQPGSTVRAWHGDTPIDLSPFSGSGEYVRSFRTSAVLPFDAELRIEIDPVPRDLAGLVAEGVPATVRTMSDPGLFAEDGFENDPVAITGIAEIVTGVGTLPAIAGARSVLVEPRYGLTMRLPVAAGETHLRFRARLLYEDTSFGCESHGIRVGSPGLDGVQRISIPSSDEDPREVIDDSFWAAAGPITDVEMALPAGTGGELIFDIYELPPLLCPTTAILLDDLRVE
jgi:hypothetical protein